MKSPQVTLIISDCDFRNAVNHKRGDRRKEHKKESPLGCKFWALLGF
jgi:hypothetical protein